MPGLCRKDPEKFEQSLCLAEQVNQVLLKSFKILRKESFELHTTLLIWSARPGYTWLWGSFAGREIEDVKKYFFFHSSTEQTSLLLYFLYIWLANRTVYFWSLSSFTSGYRATLNEQHFQRLLGDIHRQISKFISYPSQTTGGNIMWLGDNKITFCSPQR